MDIFYASCWYNFYVFTIVPRDFYDSARDFYDSDPTAPIRCQQQFALRWEMGYELNDYVENFTLCENFRP